MASYPFTNNMNSQLSEQLNNSLRKLATVAAYSKVDTYIKFLEVFITVRNLSVKNGNSYIYCFGCKGPSSIIEVCLPVPSFELCLLE